MNDLIIYQPPPVPMQAETDSQLIELWLRSHRSKKTRTEYRRDILSLSGFADIRGVNSLALIKLAHLQEYAESLVHKSPNTQRRMLASVKSLFSFARKIGYLQFDVAAAVKLPKPKNTLAMRILSEADVMKMILLEPKPRNQLLIRLLYASAARISEAVSLRWRDLQPQNESGVVILYGKGEKTRVVALPSKIYADLQAIRANDDEFVFPSKIRGAIRKGTHLTPAQAFRIVAAAAKRAGITAKVSPHWMRHAHASHALQNGANIKLVQETLGHASLAVTSGYTHARPDQSSALYLKID